MIRRIKKKQVKSKKYMNEPPGVDRHEDRDDAGYCGERQHLYLWPGWRIFKTSWLGGQLVLLQNHNVPLHLSFLTSYTEDHNNQKNFLGSPPSSQHCHVKEFLMGLFRFGSQSKTYFASTKKPPRLSHSAWAPAQLSTWRRKMNSNMFWWHHCAFLCLLQCFIGN